MAWSGALADMLDPPPVAGVELWLCDRPDCDGRPHGDWVWNHARAKQRPPDGVWFLWMILAGRGFGKTRTVSEWLVDGMERNPGSYWAWVAPTFDDGRDIGIEGESGVRFVLDRLKILHDWNRSLGQLTLRKSQARLDLFTAEKPESLRGPNLRGAVGDEPATWKYPQATWSNLMLMCRIGHPHIAISGTPKPTQFVRELVAKANHLTVGDTYENRDNLADIWFEEVIAPMEGTALGQQEIYARILDQAAGALWRREWLRVVPLDGTELDRVRVAWDPAITSTAKSDAHGIIAVGQGKPIVVGKDKRGKPVRYAPRWVLADRSGVMTPDAAARKVVQLALQVDAGRVLFEPNQGGDVWEVLYRQAAKDLGVKAPVIEKRSAVGNKESRAAPVSQVYEQQYNLDRLQALHVPGLEELEMEMCTWEPGVTKESPNRIDALLLGWQALDAVEGYAACGLDCAEVGTPHVRRQAPSNGWDAVGCRPGVPGTAHRPGSAEHTYWVRQWIVLELATRQAILDSKAPTCETGPMTTTTDITTLASPGWVHPQWRRHMPLVLEPWSASAGSWLVAGDLREIVDFDDASTNYLVAERLGAWTPNPNVEIDPEYSRFFAYCASKAVAIAVKSSVHSHARAIAKEAGAK